MDDFKHSKQTDSYNYDVICLLFFENLLLEQFNCEYDDKILIDYRKKLYDLLIKIKKIKILFFIINSLLFFYYKFYYLFF